VGTTFGALINTATRIGTRIRVGDGGKITWWEKWKFTCTNTCEKSSGFGEQDITYPNYH
jgi:hypothetical protein